MTEKQTEKTEEKPGFIARAINDLEDHFERGEEGKRTGYERPDVEQETEPDPTTLDAEDFHHLTEQAEEDKQKKIEAQREANAERRKERVDELLDQHLDDEHWKTLIGRARDAAKSGQKEFELMRFPSQLCSDGGRAINVSEEGWAETLRGEPKELHDRWETDLKDQGFRLSAKILDFPEGFPGDAGLYLSWEQ